MKLNIISDLHTEFSDCEYSHIENFPDDIDLILYAGDMGQRFYEEIKNFNEEFGLKGKLKIFGCKGNHYYYDKKNRFKIRGAVSTFCKGDYVFFSTTLWTDFALGGEQEANMYRAYQNMNDYNYIFNEQGENVIPEDILREHKLAKKNLQKSLNKYKDKKCIVVTHHSPSSRSTHEEYIGNRLNSAYMSNMDDFILKNPQIKLWVHGHIHSSTNYKIGNCMIICNPRGYEQNDGSPQNKDFNPKLVIEV